MATVLVGSVGECLAWPHALLTLAHRLGLLDPFGVLARLGVLDLLGVSLPAAGPSAAPAAPAAPGPRPVDAIDLTLALVVLPAGQCPALVYVNALRERSRPPARSYLRTIARFVRPDAELETFAWHALRWQHVEGIRARLRDRYAPGAARNALSSLRGVLRTAHRLDLIGGGDLYATLAATRG